MTHDLEIATKELDQLRGDVVLSKRKIELRDRFLADKERQMLEWEQRLTEAEQQLIRDREDVLAKLDESIVSHISLGESHSQDQFLNRKPTESEQNDRQKQEAKL